jgi:hypothetical protein
VFSQALTAVQLVCWVEGDARCDDDAAGADATTRLKSVSQDRQHDVRMHVQIQFTQGISIHNNADSPHARPTLRAALHARQHRSTHSL